MRPVGEAGLWAYPGPRFLALLLSPSPYQLHPQTWPPGDQQHTRGTFKGVGDGQRQHRKCRNARPHVGWPLLCPFSAPLAGGSSLPFLLSPLSCVPTAFSPCVRAPVLLLLLDFSLLLSPPLSSCLCLCTSPCSVTISNPDWFPSQPFDQIPFQGTPLANVWNRDELIQEA